MNLREQIEKEITDKVMTKLASEKVELGAIDEIDAQIKKTVGELNGIRNLMRQAEKAAAENLKKVDNLQSDFNKIESMVKLLGLDMPKEVEKNFKIANDLRVALKKAIGNLGSAIASI
jgi:predicted  nucleic acid-binding Zn-ribbon protein